MKLIDGKIFKKMEHQIIIDHLRAIKSESLEVYAGNLQIINDNNNIVLLHKQQNKIDSYGIRRTFLYKLLKWFFISYHNISHFSDDTLINICNDNLKALANKHNTIILKLENNQAISIVSEYFTPVSDLEVIDIVKKKMKNFTISRDDFGMRIYSEILSEEEPIKNDVCGFGYNITNSQTGFLSLQAEHYILRYWCSNGATSKISSEFESYPHYKQNRKVILEKLDYTLGSMPLQPNNFIQKIQNALHIKANDLFPNVTYKVNNIIGNQQGYYFFKTFDKKKTKYDLYNHITHTAKKFSILERYKLEQFAGDML
jgi:hypothetical protein